MKFVVVAATDGGTSDTGAAAAFYLPGVALMAAGSTWVGCRLAAGRGRALLALLALLSPFVFFLSFAVLDGVGKAAVGDTGPAWLEDEIGILLTGAAWLAASLLGRRAAARGSARSRDAKRLLATGLLVLLVTAFGACGGGDDDDSASASADYCDVAHEMTAVEDMPTNDLLDRYVEAASEQIRDDADYAAKAIKASGEGAFEDPRVGQAVDRIENFETSECGIEHEEE